MLPSPRLKLEYSAMVLSIMDLKGAKPTCAIGGTKKGVTPSLLLVTVSASDASKSARKAAASASRTGPKAA